jgi:hypothetical protein
MSYDRMRLYDAGRFHDTDLPDWYREAERLCETERMSISTGPSTACSIASTRS